MRNYKKMPMRQAPREFFVPLETLLFNPIYPDLFIFILMQYDRPEYFIKREFATPFL